MISPADHGTEPVVRFDSFLPGAERSLRFSGLTGIIATDRVEDVVAALGEVDAAVRSGFHAAGFVAYEAAPGLDSSLVTHAPLPRLPLVWFAVYRSREVGEAEPASREVPGSLGRWEAASDESDHARCIARIRDWIEAGDAYQVNHTLRLRAPFRGDVESLYLHLARGQRSAHSALLSDGRFAVVSASPELFFRNEGGELVLRPMKGTRRRGRWSAEDEALGAELVASAKDRAENLMIVDLLRNDAGRVAEWGSVTVPELFALERYPTVHQLTSTVAAHPRADVTLVDTFRALFPSGSVTGAPKVRAMQIIRELEPEPRGVYTGAIGIVSPDRIEFSVAIRTVYLDLERGTAELGVGSGVTHGSEARAEWEECLAKADFTRAAPVDFELLETLRLDPAGYFLLDRHLERLSASARYFGFAYDELAVRAALDAAADGATRPARVRLLLARAGSARVEAAALRAVPDLEPLGLAISAEPVCSADAMLFHKTTLRSPYESRLSAAAGADAVILVNERGEVTESDRANVVVEIGGDRLTPPLDAGLLPGVYRAELLASGRIRESTIAPDDLRRADALYLINSVWEWRRATLLPS